MAGLDPAICRGTMLTMTEGQTIHDALELSVRGSEPSDHRYYQPTETLTYAVMTGHLSPHVLIEMTGSVASHDDGGFNGRASAAPRPPNGERVHSSIVLVQVE